VERCLRQLSMRKGTRGLKHKSSLNEAPSKTARNLTSKTSQMVLENLELRIRQLKNLCSDRAQKSRTVTSQGRARAVIPFDGLDSTSKRENGESDQKELPDYKLTLPRMGGRSKTTKKQKKKRVLLKGIRKKTPKLRKTERSKEQGGKERRTGKTEHLSCSK